MSDWLDAERHVERAHELYERGRWSEAEDELRRAIAVNPYQAEWHFNLGLTLEAAGRFADAASSFEEASELQPGEWAPAMSAAVNLLQAGEAERALCWLDRAEAAGAEPGDVDVHRIEALTDLGRHDDAELAFYLAQQRDDGNPALLAAMGDALLDREQRSRALWCYREAARLDEELPQIFSRLARAHDAMGRSERARQLYLRELRRDPGDIDSLLDLADLLRRMQRPAESAEKLRRVLELDPRCGEAHAALSELADQAGDLEGAIAAMDVAVRLDPGIPHARLRLATLLIRRGRRADGERIDALLDDEVTAVAGDAEPDVDRLLDLGEALLDAGRPADGARVFRRLVEVESDRLRGRHLLSVALLEAGDEAEGMALAREVVREHPRHVEAMHNLALAHMRRGEWLRARYWVTQAVQVDPEDGPVRRLRARLLLRTLGAVFGGFFGAARWVSRQLVGLVIRPARA